MGRFGSETSAMISATNEIALAKKAAAAPHQPTKMPAIEVQLVVIREKRNDQCDGRRDFVALYQFRNERRDRRHFKTNRDSEQTPKKYHVPHVDLVGLDEPSGPAQARLRNESRSESCACRTIRG